MTYPTLVFSQTNKPPVLILTPFQLALLPQVVQSVPTLLGPGVLDVVVFQLPHPILCLMYIVFSQLKTFLNYNIHVNNEFYFHLV